MSFKTKSGFYCSHCGKWVPISELMGTHHRNHCPFCLWSKHVDLKKEGDRKSNCQGEMKPIGLTFKKQRPDKYGKEKKGELMIIHYCQNCGKISINRIAADDNPLFLKMVFEKSLSLPKDLKTKLENQNIIPAKKVDREEIENQLYGKK
jgi:hypothetical protein